MFLTLLLWASVCEYALHLRLGNQVLAFEYHMYIVPEERMPEDNCLQTLLPGLDVALAVSGASVVFGVSADSSVEVLASENMHCI